MERWRQPLDADEHLAGLELLDQPARRLGRVRDLVRVLAEPGADIARAGRDRLAHRRQVHPLDRAQRALRLGLEPAQRLDLVAEQLDSHRVGCERCVDVDHAAAHRERAGLVDDRGPAPARGDQRGRQLVAVDRLAEPDRAPASRELGGGQRPAHQGLGRGHDDPRRQAGGQPVERRDALDDAGPIRRQIRVRRDVDPGQRGDLVERRRRVVRTAPEHAHVGLEPPRGGVVGRDDHDEGLALRDLDREPGGPPGRRAVHHDDVAGEGGRELGHHRAAS